jgi:hypothetical protein
MVRTKPTIIAMSLVVFLMVLSLWLEGRVAPNQDLTPEARAKASAIQHFAQSALDTLK